MNRFATILTLLLLAVPAFAQRPLAPLPDDARFDAPVEFSTGISGESLVAMIDALARSVGLTAVTDDVQDVSIVYNIGDPKPFRQVWNIVLTLNDLDYVLLDNDIVVVGTSGSVTRLRGATSPAAAEGGAVPASASAASEVVQSYYRVNGDVAQVEALLRTALRGIDVEALPGVSTLVVRGTSAEHAQVASLLSEFDPYVEPVRLEQRRYQLSNALANELAGVLMSTATAGSNADGETAVEFTVVADERTNSLIVTALPEVQARLSDLIPNLDEPRKQVNVQVRIQEVAHSISYDLGLNITGGLGQFTSSILDTGLNFIFNSGAAVSSFNIGAILDALETQGLSRRVDDGSVTVLDNQTGEIQSGGTIFISIPGSAENIEREIPYGVQLTITPRVANDGSVTLVIDASVEDVLSTTNDPSYLELSTRKVSSTINLQPGQTALLGGLLQSNFTQSKKRVPILGSIPLLGELFGTTVTQDEKSDLILVVNAQVID